MLRTPPPRLSAVILISLGFVSGVVSVVGCGGSSAAADGGSTTSVHVKSLGAPITFMDEYTFSVEYTPSDPNTVILGAQMVCGVEVTGSQVLVRLNARLDSYVSPIGGMVTIDPQFAPPGPITAGITGPYALSADRLPGPTYQFEASLDALVNNVPVTLDSLTIRIITTQGVIVMDPSPDLL